MDVELANVLLQPSPHPRTPDSDGQGIGGESFSFFPFFFSYYIPRL